MSTILAQYMSASNVGWAQQVAAAVDHVARAGAWQTGTPEANLAVEARNAPERTAQRFLRHLAADQVIYATICPHCYRPDATDEQLLNAVQVAWSAVGVELAGETVS